MEKRNQNPRKNDQKKLLILIAVLAVLLVVTLVVAVAVTPKQDSTLNNPGTETSEQTKQTTQAPPETTQTPTKTTQPPTETTQAPPETTLPETTVPPETVGDTTPDYGEYIDVGSGYIAEVVTYAAETFNGKTTDDYSAPIRNFLPEGTVDYASSQVITNGNLNYVLLRCGRRVYVDKKNTPGSTMVQVTKCYSGTLPDHNEVGFVSMKQEDHFTILTLDVLWKAPFYFDMAPQSYYDPAARDYQVSDFTAKYIDITFCYATEFEGTVAIDAGNPLFKSAELIRNESDCTLRLYLKKTGGFYGYDAYYNENDQLCFKFLNPVSGKETTSNRYGADLSGIRIMIDVGHGGVDCGSPVTLADGTLVEEADLNLALAKMLKAELESMGATVILNRTGDTTLRVDERITALKDAAPDICICIHQNAYSGDSSVNGLQLCYSTPFSHDLAMRMYDSTMDAGIYKRGFTSWHYYFIAKQTNCPVVLMECGYMTNASDLAGMLDDAVALHKAQAMAEAIAEYFLNIG